MNLRFIKGGEGFEALGNEVHLMRMINPLVPIIP